MTTTRVERRKNHQALQVMGFPERVALFVAAIHKGRADELLAGFSKPSQERASAFAQDMKQWDSARRQARLAHEFGVRPDAGERIQQLVVKTSGDLRAAIVASLPPAVRAQFPQFVEGATGFPVAVRALAARLVKEASR
ncbi:MAG: hypothetical protein Q8L48_06575 [Archangium sp.]|nr:hypothetical protein [Archangium sp.]